jgi:molybdopterin converting factor small subunit
MLVRVRLLGLLRDAAGASEASVSLGDGSSLGGVLDDLMEMYPGLRGALGDLAEVNPPQGILILLDGVEAGNLRGLGTPVRDGSEVVLVPVTHGG